MMWKHNIPLRASIHMEVRASWSVIKPLGSALFSRCRNRKYFLYRGNAWSRQFLIEPEMFAIYKEKEIEKHGMHN